MDPGCWEVCSAQTMGRATTLPAPCFISSPSRQFAWRQPGPAKSPVLNERAVAQFGDSLLQFSLDVHHDRPGRPVPRSACRTPTGSEADSANQDLTMSAFQSLSGTNRTCSKDQATDVFDPTETWPPSIRIELVAAC